MDSSNPYTHIFQACFTGTRAIIWLDIIFSLSICMTSILIVDKYIINRGMWCKRQKNASSFMKHVIVILLACCQYVWLVIKLYWTRTTRTPAFWDTPRRPMNTSTSDSHQIPTQNKTKSKLQIFKNCQKLKFCKKLYMRHTLWSCLVRCINMKWIQPEL